MVTNCSGQRLFLQLKHMKNDLPTTNLKERLSALSIMCIESDKIRSVLFQVIIYDFALQRSQKRY
jgi:hypothetical protein